MGAARHQKGDKRQLALVTAPERPLPPAPPPHILLPTPLLASASFLKIKKKKSLLPFSDIKSSICSLLKNQKMKVGRDISASICLDPGRLRPRRQQTLGRLSPSACERLCQAPRSAEAVGGCRTPRAFLSSERPCGPGDVLHAPSVAVAQFIAQAPASPSVEKVPSLHHRVLVRSPQDHPGSSGQGLCTQCAPYSPPGAPAPVPSPAVRAGHHSKPRECSTPTRTPQPACRRLGNTVPSPRPAVAVAPAAGRPGGEVVSVPGTGPVPV